MIEEIEGSPYKWRDVFVSEELKDVSALQCDLKNQHKSNQNANRTFYRQVSTFRNSQGKAMELEQLKQFLKEEES